jgi:dihydrofolate reductase
MREVVVDISMSLDGFVTGPNAGPDNGLGDGAEALHTWAFADDPVDRELLAAGVERSGAVILGRKLFDVVDGPDGWNDEVGYGAAHAARPPMFVVTHTPPAATRLPFFTFVDGIEAAVEQALAAAGDGDAVVMGGGHVARQVIALGLADRILIHHAPLLLGAGTPLFDGGEPVALRQVDVTVSPYATHITYVPAS